MWQVALEIPASPSATPSFVALDTLPKLSSSSLILLFDTSSDLKTSVKLINLWEHLKFDGLNEQTVKYFDRFRKFEMR